MAITATPMTGNLATGNLRGWTVKATADADSTIAITHGITFADPANDPTKRCRAVVTPLSAAFHKQDWVVTSITATVINLEKTNVTSGTGDAAETLAVYVEYLGCPFQ